MADGHTITIEQGTERVRVVRGGQVVADSTRPLVLHETGYPPRYYLPPEDVRTDLLIPSDTHTVCPFKGTASYWSLPDGSANGDGSEGTDFVWSYPDPKPNVAAIRDHLCFYAAEVG